MFFYKLQPDLNVVHAESGIMNEAVSVKTEQTSNEQINKDIVDNKIEVDPTTAEVILKHI